MNDCRSILLLEDDAVLGKHLHRWLQRMGFATTWTASLREFEQAARCGTYDAVVLDVSLPDGDGIEAWSRLRELQQSARTVAVTANDSDDVRARARAAGIGELFCKPVRLAHLVSSLAPYAAAA